MSSSEYPIVRDSPNPVVEETTTILQVVPAQPGTVAVYASSSKNELPYYTEPVFCWALVERTKRYQNNAEEIDRFVFPMVSNPEESDPSTQLVIEEGIASFLGYSFPGDTTDWQKRALERREELG